MVELLIWIANAVGIAGYGWLWWKSDGATSWAAAGTFCALVFAAVFQAFPALHHLYAGDFRPLVFRWLLASGILVTFVKTK